MRCHIMTLTAAALVFLATVSAQVPNTGYKTFSDPDANRLASDLLNSTACPEQLVNSLGQLILPSAVKFTSLCSTSYFVGCKDEFIKQCAKTNCSATAERKDYYEKWVDAFSTYGKSYTCNTIGYNKSIDVLNNQGGYACISQFPIKVLNPISKIVKLMWSGVSFTCSDMSAPMEEIRTLLTGCENPALKNLVTDYLNTVSDQTQCAKSITVGGGTTTIGFNNAAIFTMVVTSVLVYLRF